MQIRCCQIVEVVNLGSPGVDLMYVSPPHTYVTYIFCEFKLRPRKVKLLQHTDFRSENLHCEVFHEQSETPVQTSRCGTRIRLQWKKPTRCKQIQKPKNHMGLQNLFTILSLWKPSVWSLLKHSIHRFTVETNSRL